MPSVLVRPSVADLAGLVLAQGALSTALTND